MPNHIASTELKSISSFSLCKHLQRSSSRTEQDTVNTTVNNSENNLAHTTSRLVLTKNLKSRSGNCYYLQTKLDIFKYPASQLDNMIFFRK